MTINATAAILLCLYLASARKQGIAFDKVDGTIQNDILKEYIAGGTYIFPPEPSLRLSTDTFAFCAREVPKWNTISISGYHIREAGATAVQEVAFTFADAIAYVEAALKAGLEIDEFTTEIERRVVDYLDKIEAIGGTLNAIETGYIQREIQNSAYEYQRAIETGDAIVVGVNKFESEDEGTVKTLRIDPSIEKDQ